MGSWSRTIMQDQRIAVEEAGVIAGVESVLTMPSSVAIAEGAEVGDVTIQQYTPEVKETVFELIQSVRDISLETIPTLVRSFGQSMSETAETSMKVTGLLGEKLQETQVGTASILPGVAKYLLIAAVVIIVAGKVWK